MIVDDRKSFRQPDGNCNYQRLEEANSWVYRQASYTANAVLTRPFPWISMTGRSPP